MIRCEHFLYGITVPNGQLKTRGVTKLLTDTQRQYLIDCAKPFTTPARFWVELPDARLVAVAHVHPDTDTYGRHGIWLHVILCPVTDYLHHTNPVTVFDPHFITTLPPDTATLEPITLPDPPPTGCV